MESAVLIDPRMNSVGNSAIADRQPTHMEIIADRLNNLFCALENDACEIEAFANRLLGDIPQEERCRSSADKSNHAIDHTLCLITLCESAAMRNRAVLNRLDRVV